MLYGDSNGMICWF